MKTIFMLTCTLGVLGGCSNRKQEYAVIISANMEWRSLKKIYPHEAFQTSIWGEYFFKEVNDQNILFFHEGWGKVSAAAATQYVIETYHPDMLINLGTCGGFEGEIEKFDIVLADKTIIYDITEAMGDSKEAIDSYTTDIDLSWLGNDLPSKVIKTVLVSADRDLRPDEIEQLKKQYAAVAGDWESGAISYTAQRNKTKILILRGVSDLVTTKNGETYGNFDLFTQRTDTVMSKLLTELPKWIDHLQSHQK
jgi:adenosylhomocysteine nucleosidase